MSSIAQGGYRGVERRKAARSVQSGDYGWKLFLILVTLLMAAGYLVSRFNLYKSGDRIGYNLGLTGGLMMLPLLLYPLRKRLRFMNNWGLLPNWFRLHMMLGVLGPAIVMLHTTFSIRSINAGVALLCMMLVSGSGIFGRFFYTKVHYGLYGRQMSFKQLQEELEGTEYVKSIFSFAPEIQMKLIRFRNKAMILSPVGKISLWNFLTLGIRAQWLHRSLIRDLEEAMYGDAQEKNWNDVQMKRLDEIFYQNKDYIEKYLQAVQNVALFSTYEKLFSLWHLFHVPLVYMLVFSAIWHVIAVHMY
ncbi:MAG TPA: hypothetical protein VIU46_06765 [Gallionellaceae bacterium]